MDLRLSQPTFMLDESIPRNKSPTVGSLLEPWWPMVETKMPTTKDPKSKYILGPVFPQQIRNDSEVDGMGRGVHLSRIFLGAIKHALFLLTLPQQDKVIVNSPKANRETEVTYSTWSSQDGMLTHMGLASMLLLQKCQPLSSHQFTLSSWQIKHYHSQGK